MCIQLSHIEYVNTAKRMREEANVLPARRNTCNEIRQQQRQGRMSTTCELFHSRNKSLAHEIQESHSLMRQ